MWQAAPVTCELCEHRWVAVFPIECDELECPGCGHMTPTSVGLGLAESEDDGSDDWKRG
jgi:hypothetical protein